MKFRCERDVLVEALGSAGRAAAGRSGALPVLGGVRLSILGDAMEVTGTDLDLTIGSLTVPKGDYSLYILPEENQWTLIVNTQTGQWGIKRDGSTSEDPAKDLGRVVMKVSKPAAPVDTFAITLTKDGSQGSLAMAWENTVATVAYTVK